MEEEFEEFIDERLNNEYHKLTQSSKWQEDTKQYNNAYSNLCKQLDTKQKNLLDKLMDVRSFLASDECQFAYRVGFTDFVKTFKV